MSKKFETIMKDVTERQQEAIEVQKKKLVKAEDDKGNYADSLYLLREMIEDMTEYQVIYAETFLNRMFFNGNYEPAREGVFYRDGIRSQIMQLNQEKDLHFFNGLLVKILEIEKAPCSKQEA